MTSPNEVITDAKLLRKDVQELKAIVEAGGGTGGGISPSVINNKGDLIVGTASDTVGVIPVGIDGNVLTADSTNPSGVKWAPPPVGDGGTGVAGVASVNGRTGTVTLAKGDVGLGNVDNTADSQKPISSATQTALNAKADSATLTSHLNNTSNPHATTKAQVGLANVDNTSDANKPISAATQVVLNQKADAAATTTALAGKADAASVTSALAAKADLVGGKVPLEQLPEQGGTGVQVWEWYVDTAVQGTGIDFRYNDSGQDLTIVAVRVRATIASPTGQALIVDINKNGLSIFSSTSNQPRIAAGETDSGKVTAIATTTLSDGDYLVPDLDQVGSIVPGSGILVTVTLR